VTTVTPAQQRTLAVIEAELARLARYDDESVVHEAWIRQRYDSGFAASYAPARAEAVRTAWHEAGHAVAALELGARFSSASIRAGAASAGRVHAIRGGGELGFVIDAAGQVAERLRDWTLPETDADVRAWLASWRGDGGDARRFRAGITARFGADEAAAWRYTAAVLTPLRPRIRGLARALLVYPRHLPYPVTAVIAGFGVTSRRQSNPDPISAPGSDGGANGRQESGLRHGRLPVPGGLLPGKRVFPVKSRMSAELNVIVGIRVFAPGGLRRA
jgi:hypothetical protein